MAFSFDATVVPSTAIAMPSAPTPKCILLDIQDEMKDDDNDATPLLPMDDTPSSPHPISWSSRLCGWIGTNKTKLYGIGLVAGGNILASLMTVLIKFAAKFLSSEEIVFWRSFIAVLCNIAIQVALKIPLFDVPSNSRVVVVARSVLGYIAMSLSFYAYSTMVLSEASVIIYSAPIVTFAVGIIFLHEKLDRLDFGCTFVSFLGVVCVARPAFLFGATNSAASPLLSVIAAILAAIFLGLANVLIRKLHDVNTLTLVTYHLITCAFFAGLKVLVFQSGFTIPTEPSRIVTLLAIGVLGCLGQVMVTKGFQVEKAGIASAMQYINTMCIMVWDVTLLGQTLHAFSVVGALVIVASSAVVAYRRTQSK
ncbi:Aste57867_12725 [Aphanomyces stellatus]|uniref:Aste57867_12725 protein n=1 Tax=Aphanomyces stellatus TaxID=120398 RepID=A0A485KX51_9STRA|nr:hypothetical protein As57867_012677 [Aphanomyces stellatus]VFT89575.1 Aste57867_12725 [Aphanomyces stellatus]